MAPLQEIVGGNDRLGRDLAVGREGEEQRFVAREVGEHGAKHIRGACARPQVGRMEAGQCQEPLQPQDVLRQERKSLGRNGFRRVTVDRTTFLIALKHVSVQQRRQADLKQLVSCSEAESAAEAA